MRRRVTAVLIPAAAMVGLALPGVAGATTVPCATTVDDGAGGVFVLDSKGTVEATVAVTEGAVTNTQDDAFDRTLSGVTVNGTSYDAGATACDKTVDPVRGTAIRFPEKAAGALQVTRVIAFRAVPLAGTGRSVHAMVSTVIVRNPTAAPVGATLTVAQELGSDAGTALRTLGGGTTTPTPASLQVATIDTVGGDPTVYHGWSTNFGFIPDPPDSVGIREGASDVFDVAWTGVNVPANGVRTFTKVTAVSLRANGDPAAELADLNVAEGRLRGGNLTFTAAAPALTAGEISASQNFPVPTTTVNGGLPTRAATAETVRAAMTATSTAPEVAQCVTGRTLSLDGAPVLTADGRVDLPAGAAGVHPWSLSTTSACGNTVLNSSLTVADGITACRRGLSAGRGLPFADRTGALYDPDLAGDINTGGWASDGLIFGTADQPGIEDFLSLRVGVTGYGNELTDAAGCAVEADGRLLRTPVAVMDGLEVRRSTWVPAGGPGARLVTTLRNPGGAAITVPLQVDDGDGLGSGYGVIATGNGAATASPAARWFALDDADGEGRTPVAVVFDGPGGRDGADSVAVAAFNMDIGYDAVTVAPGETVSYMQWMAQRRRQPRAAGEAADAAAAGAEMVGLSGAALYGGMGAAEIASVRNWALPVPTGTLSGPASGAVGMPQTFAVNGLAGGADTPQCGAGSVAWKVDGAAVAGGSSIAPVFATAGAHTVSATITGACGADPLVRTATFTAAAPAKIVEPPKPPVKTTVAKLSALKLSGACVKAPKAKATLKVSLKAVGASKVQLKLVRLAGKAPKACVLASSAAGKKLLKARTVKTVLTKKVTVKAGSAAFAIALKALLTGSPKLKGTTLALPRGAYRLTVSLTTGKKPITGLVIVR